MSDTLESKPLVSLASLKGAAGRDGLDSKTRNAVANSTRGGSFDGFLNTFLGKDKTGKSGFRTGARVNQASTNNGMKTSEKQALKKSMDKTVQEDGEVLEESAEAIAAAEEAAMLIWNLLYGHGMAGLVGSASPVCTSLAKLSVMIQSGAFQPGTFSGFPGGLSRAAMQDAIDSANASAEMNNAAVLDALDGLLDGMPRSALERALSRTAGVLGLGMVGGGDAFAAVTGALEAQITGINTMAGATLLAQLGRNNSALSAETAGPDFTSSQIVQRFQEFVQEKFDGERLDALLDRFSLSDTKAAKELTAGFAAWLQDSGNPSNPSQLATAVNKLFELLASGAAASGEEGGETDFDKISLLTRNLEKALQVPANKTAETADNAEQLANAEITGKAVPGARADSQSGPGGGQGSENGPSFAFGQDAQPATVQATRQEEHINTMLQQIDNIERLAEAMSMVRRNSVNNITMQLAPAELGRVLLKVESRNGVVSAFLRVEKPEAAAQLGNSLGQLRDTLKNMGIELGDLEIEYQPAPGLLDDLAGESRQGWREAESSPPASSPGEASDAEEADAAGAAGQGALNLFA